MPRETMGQPFWKLTGAGNDFVAIDNMAMEIPDDDARAGFVRAACARRVGVGADGVLLVEPSKALDFRMRYYNADGGEAETCGNGARCIARFAHLLGIAGESMRFDTEAGPYEAWILGDTVRISMSDAHSLKMGIDLSVAGHAEQVDSINTGVPHALIFVEDLEATPVVDLGRSIRQHEAFAPEGTNANFVARMSEDHLAVRTYERGVEDETLACGTGCIAAAIAALRRGTIQSTPVRTTTRGGRDLIVDFEPTDDGASHVTLEGEARVVFRGELD